MSRVGGCLLKGLVSNMTILIGNLHVVRYCYRRCREVGRLRGRRDYGAVLFLENPRSSVLRNPFPEKKDGNKY